MATENRLSSTVQLKGTHRLAKEKQFHRDNRNPTYSHQKKQELNNYQTDNNKGHKKDQDKVKVRIALEDKKLLKSRSQSQVIKISMMF